MKKQIAILSLILASCTLIFYSCSKTSDPAPTPTPNTSFNGTWTHTVTGVILKLNFKTDNTYAFSIDTLTGEVGSYTNANSVVTFNATSSTCLNRAGVYSFSISGTSMTLTLKSDSCSDRSPYVLGAWTKQ